MSYATVEEFKRYLSITDASLDDLLMQSVLDGSTSAIDGYCGQGFTADTVATARTFLAYDPSLVYVDAIADTTGATVAVDTSQSGTFGSPLTVSSQYIWEPVNATVGGLVGFPVTRVRLVGGQAFQPATYGRPQVQVTAKWGWPDVPAPVHMACLQVAGEMWKRKDAPFGILEGVEFGPIRMSPDVMRSVQALLRPYRRAESWAQA